MFSLNLDVQGLIDPGAGRRSVWLSFANFHHYCLPDIRFLFSPTMASMRQRLVVRVGRFCGILEQMAGSFPLTSFTFCKSLLFCGRFAAIMRARVGDRGPSEVPAVRWTQQSFKPRARSPLLPTRSQFQCGAFP